MTPAPAFHLDFFRFNGKGNLPSVVPTPDQANFMRTRQSVDEALIGVVMERVAHHSPSETNATRKACLTRND